VDGQIQFYASNVNENIYTNGWEGPYDGYDKVVETFQETETPKLVQSPPRRVSPINIYYHFYSGEKHAALEALKTVYEYALTQEIIPIFTSEYLSIVEGFLSGKVEKTEDGAWRFFDYGDARTVRFDDVKEYPDILRSKGVLGFKRWHNYLYVYLEKSEEAVLHFSEMLPKVPYLKEAANIVSDMRISQEKVSFAAHGYKEGFFLFANMKPSKRYEVRLISKKNGNEQRSKKFKSDSEGNLSVKVNILEPVQIIIKGL